MPIITLNDNRTSPNIWTSASVVPRIFAHSSSHFASVCVLPLLLSSSLRFILDRSPSLSDRKIRHRSTCISQAAPRSSWIAGDSETRERERENACEKEGKESRKRTRRERERRGEGERGRLQSQHSGGLIAKWRSRIDTIGL